MELWTSASARGLKSETMCMQGAVVVESLAQIPDIRDLVVVEPKRL